MQENQAALIGIINRGRCTRLSEFRPGCGDLSLQGTDGRDQRRPGPTIPHLRSWNRGSAWPDREKT